MRKCASYEAGRTFVQDGFDARTGDEREPREQPWRKGEKGEGGTSTSGARAREKRGMR